MPDDDDAVPPAPLEVDMPLDVLDMPLELDAPPAPLELVFPLEVVELPELVEPPPVPVLLDEEPHANIITPTTANAAAPIHRRIEDFPSLRARRATRRPRPMRWTDARTASSERVASYDRSIATRSASSSAAMRAPRSNASRLRFCKS